jgi:hypothetical protein
MLALALSLAAAATPPAGPSLPVTLPQDVAGTQTQVSASTFAAWRDHIVPHADEDRWLQIEWHDSTSAGFKAATEQNRPMLLWLMNGHPLGCT